MRFRFVSWLSGSLLLLALLLTSCSRDPQVRKQRYFESGQRYFEKGKYGEAAVEFLNAVKIDPTCAEAHHQLAESYLRLQKPEGAFPELGRTLELQPQNYGVRIELANLLVLGRNFPEGQNQINLLLKERPNDLAAQGNVSAAIDEMQKTIAIDPGHWQFYLSLALLQAQNNLPDAAEASLHR